jgi:hypothetical protein
MLTQTDNDRKEHVQRVISWQESVATLPDSRFFDIMRVYLGEVKTPYNKQKLIEQLSAFFHREQNRENLAAMLDDFDKQIITAVAVLPEVTQTRLSDFFAGEYTLSKLYTRLLNLIDRLIIYKDRQVKGAQQYIHLNPLLDETLAPYISLSRILPPAVCAERFDAPQFCISPLFTASFLSYIGEKPDLCKSDGVLKKNDAAHLEELFPGRGKCLQLLFTAFLNLSILKQGEKSVTIDRDRLDSFAQLPQNVQYAFICAASTGHLSREALRSQAQLFLDCSASIPPEGFSRVTLQREAFLIGSTAPAEGRFSRMIDESRGGQYAGGERAGMLFDRIIDSAETFGLLQVTGKTEKGISVYRPSPSLSEECHKGAKVLNIDAGFTVTVMPGLPLAELVPLASFMNIVRCNTAAEFEITRSSVIRAFDAGLTTESVCALLSAYTPYEIPQNLRISIEDWQNSYSAAMLYRGYVLKLDEKNAQIIEKNPNAKSYIQTKLAPGIYLLSIHGDDEASEFIAKCGLDFIGSVKSAKTEAVPSTFPLVSDGTDYLENKKTGGAASAGTGSENSAEKIMKSLHESLDALNLPALQKEGLSERIDRRIILSPEQLRGATVRTENLEAGGMDFLGKARLIESAITSKDMIELSIPDTADASKQQVYLGTPIQLVKETGDAVVHLKLEPSHEIQPFSVSQASGIRLIRTSLF